MTAILEKIYDDFYDIDPSDYIAIIKLYENNQILLDNKSTFNDEDDFNNFVLLLAKYVISLEDKGRYSKVVRYSDKLLELIDLKKDEFGIIKKDFTTYWSVMTSKGRALYNLKDYKNAILIFEKLHEWDSDNDNLRNWLNASKSRQRNSINKYLYIVASILIVAVVFFGDQIGNQEVRFYMSLFGVIIFIIILINEYLVDKILRVIRK
jgi:tetratricopeptide (TPR) repeat protein